MADTPIDLLVVTPGGGVWDYTVEADAAGVITTRSVLEALHEQIGCTTVDIVRLAPDTDMWIDDEGSLKLQLRVNQLASYIATRFGCPFQLCLGIAVFTGGPDAKGNTTPLNKPARETLLRLVDELRSIRWR